VKKYKLLKNGDKNKSNEIEASPCKRQYGLSYKKKEMAMAAQCQAPGELQAIIIKS
jgi:hypothetical protein